MVGGEGLPLNQLFDVLAEWETVLEHIGIDDIPAPSDDPGLEP